MTDKGLEQRDSVTQSSMLIPSLAVGKHPAKKCLSIGRGGNWHSDRWSQEHVLTQLWTKPGLPNHSPVPHSEGELKTHGFVWDSRGEKHLSLGL